MGGTIGVESKQGVGTTYTITLPFAIDNTATEEPEQQTDLTVLRGRRLLLAEDNALNMEIMEFLLNDVGIKVTKAADGQQAVEAFAASPVGGFDAILMDVMMPVRDGHEATRAIRAMDRPDAKSIPIFAMTARLCGGPPESASGRYERASVKAHRPGCPVLPAGKIPDRAQLNCLPGFTSGEKHGTVNILCLRKPQARPAVGKPPEHNTIRHGKPAADGKDVLQWNRAKRPLT